MARWQILSPTEAAAFEAPPVFRPNRRERAICGNKRNKRRKSISENQWNRKFLLAFWASANVKEAILTAYCQCQKEKRK